MPKLLRPEKTKLGNRLSDHPILGGCAIIRTKVHHCALRGALRAARWHWRFAQSPSTGASPCAASIGYPFTALSAEIRGGDDEIPCPHFNIRIVSRSKGESVMAAAAYQSGEKLFSEYDGRWKSGDHLERIVFKDILLPPNAPRAYSFEATALITSTSAFSLLHMHFRSNR